MVLPVTAYGHPVLRKVGKEIDKDYPDLEEFLNNMWETMYFSEGVGLAAPQVNRAIRVFIVDASPYGEQIPEARDFRQTFINPVIKERLGDDKLMEEGCLSIPQIREEVSRQESVKIQYYDADWNFHEEEFSGMIARIIQHEYDHIEGILFTDHLSSMRKTMLRSKLSNISKGKIDVDYKMIFPFMKKAKTKL